MYLIRSRFDAEVQESLPPGQEVLVLSTTSNLGGSSGGGSQPDTFQLLIESEDFSIDPYTGLISTKLRLDREKASYHLLVVGLKGGQGSGEPSDTATVNITVVDINDNDPAFTDSCKDLSLPENYQVWLLTKFYSVDFSQSRIGVKKCVFNKRTIKAKACICSLMWFM